MLGRLFTQLGLNEDETIILKYLMTTQKATVLQISKNSGINRTTLYRILDQLLKRGFVRKHKIHKSTAYSALSVDNLEHMVIQKVRESQRTLDIFQAERAQLTKMAAKRLNPSQITYYSGGVECRQLVWNALKGNVLKGFGYKTLKDVVGDKFFTEWITEAYFRGKKQKLLMNSEQFTSKQQAVIGQNRAKPIILPEILTHLDDLIELRLIDASIFNIRLETFIYDDVYAMLQWQNNNVFGIEIKNVVIAQQEEDLFELLWQQASPHFWKKPAAPKLI